MRSITKRKDKGETLYLAELNIKGFSPRKNYLETPEEAEEWLDFEEEKIQRLGKPTTEGDHKQIPLTSEERDEIEQLLKKGVAVKRIAIILNRGYTGIRNDVNYGGGRDNYSKERAEAERARKQLNQKEGRERGLKTQLLETLEEIKEKESLKKMDLIMEKLDLIQMQLQIISEHLIQNQGRN